MGIKVKHILLGLLIVIVVIFVFSIIKIPNRINSVEITEIETIMKQEYNDYYANSGDGRYEICYIVAKKNGDWNSLPLTENFRNKYNEKDGILGDIQYDNIEYRPYLGSDENYYFKDENYFVITQGKSKTLYRCLPTFNEMGTGELLEDVYLYDVKQLYDVDGNKLIVDGMPIKELYSFYYLANGGDDEKSVAVTDNFHRKYPFFLDIFEHYSPLRFNPIEFVPEKSSWEKQEAYFIVDSVLECKKRYYKVKFTLDDKGYLDDVKVNKVNEEEYNNTEKDGGLHIFYINSNWNGLNLTEKFRKKFNPSEGIFPEIKLLGNNFDFGQETEEYRQVSIGGDAKVNQIRGFKIDGKYKYYLYKVYKDEKGNIDDIVYDKLPYDNIPLEEVKELYLKEHNIQQ